MSEKNYESLMLGHGICFPLYAVSKEIIRLYRPYLEEMNLTYTQYFVMMVMWEKKKISVKEIGNFLYLDSGTLTPVLKSLESKGFVTRYRSSEDERILLVEITDEGLRLRENASTIISDVRAKVNISNEEGSVIYHQLYHLLDKLKDIE